jgi:hypothetical protein
MINSTPFKITNPHGTLESEIIMENIFLLGNQLNAGLSWMCGGKSFKTLSWFFVFANGLRDH